jgi:hypothetical protein
VIVDNKINGYCPGGCGPTLVLDGAGDVWCRAATCPRPYAVRDLISIDRVDHEVEFTTDGFALHHPTRERIDGEYQDCVILRELMSHITPPCGPGRYRVTEANGGFMYTDVKLIKN